MSQNDLTQLIKSEVFSQQAVKLSDQDPIFSFLIANKIMLDQFTAPILEAIAAIPAAIDQSLDRLVLAVEETERTAESLQVETKAVLVALTKVQLENSNQSIKDTIAGLVKTALEPSLMRAQSAVVDMQRKAAEIVTGGRTAATNIRDMAIGLSLLLVVGAFSIASWQLYSVGVENRQAADYWHSEFVKTQGGSKNASKGSRDQ